MSRAPRRAFCLTIALLPLVLLALSCGSGSTDLSKMSKREIADGFMQAIEDGKPSTAERYVDVPRWNQVPGPSVESTMRSFVRQEWRRRSKGTVVPDGVVYRISSRVVVPGYAKTLCGPEKILLDRTSSGWRVIGTRIVNGANITNC